MTIHCYPVKNKAKSLEICQAFAQGCGGVVHADAPALYEGPAFFYGVDHSNVHLWNELKVGRDFYYCDNSYFDNARQQYFRVTKNALQHNGVGYSTGDRFNKLGIQIKPWARSGRHVVVCPQSEHFMHVVVRYPGNWQGDTIERLSKLTSRPIRLRLWSSDKGKLAATLEHDLEDAYALVTYSSAAAITALLNGIPAFCSIDCAAAAVADTNLQFINEPHYSDLRLIWAGVLADNQWTLDEMRAGQAWEKLKND